MPAATDVPFALAFGAGLVASINPCGFALLPSLLFYYLGSRGSSPSLAGRVLDGLVVGLTVTAGFMVVFGTAGLLLSLGAQAVVRVVPWVTIVMGLVMAATGGWLLAGRHISMAIPGIRASRGAGYRSMFIFGIAYAVGSLSCTLPIFLLVVGAGLSAGSVLGTVGVFFAYGLGTATILLLLCLATAGFREILIRQIRRLLPYLNRISGALLLAGGSYVVYYWLSLLSGADQSGAVRLVQSLQRAAQELVASVDDRIWLVAGVGLVAGSLLTLAARLLRRDDDLGPGLDDDDEERAAVPERVEDLRSEP